MDQINRKYKKFRQPVLPAAQLQYLFDESDPNFVRPDVVEGQVRPFEIVKDKHGLDVLRESATGKIFYNLETTTIEERLSNGYYARPKDFLFDIRALAKDAKNIGDKERTLKANELVTNVEVDVASIEANTQAYNWEELFQRQTQRSKEATEKERKRKAGLAILGRVQSDVAGNDSDSPQGPVTLGEPVPGPRTTTARFQVMSPMSNGHGPSASRPLSNGMSRQEDVQMGGVDEDMQPLGETSTPMKPPPTQWGRIESRVVDQSARATAGTTQVSQRSAVTTVPPGVSPSALVNDASTTKTSDPSERSSAKWSTQATNGIHTNQDSPVDVSGSQIPDTQLQPSQASSESPWPHSQAHGLALGQPGGISGSPPSSQAQGFSSKSSSGPKSHATPTIGNLLNDPAPDLQNSGTSSSQPSQTQVTVPLQSLQAFLGEVIDQTSGFTIEQLEQINRELMDEIWRSRHDGNRVRVLGNLKGVFNDVIRDIVELQGDQPLSQEQVRI
jgi:ATPase family AAA domain-containing protein 2